jgi:DNA (cytosine-5)-methyltransferase 1
MPQIKGHLIHYYNEWDPFAAAWLRNLIAAGLLPDGDVDDRSITDVQPSDLTGYTQCHFFAGIGGWPLALELAGWPPDAPVWTGSCPCQPFSTAGRGGGESDPRHLWPQFARLIEVCRPSVVFGEQVASFAGRGWVAGVRADLESMDYAVGASDLCAASVGAPHIRSRLWWVAESSMARWPQASTGPALNAGNQPEPKRSALDSGVADADVGRWNRERESEQSTEQGSPRNQPDRYGSDGQFINTKSGLADAECSGRMDAAAHDREHAAAGRSERDAALDQRQSRQGRGDENASEGSGVGNAERTRREKRRPSLRGEPSHRAGGEPIATAGFWDNAESLPCLDGKSRRIEPGTPPLVDGFPGRVGQLRAYGNAISPQVAAEFVRAYREVLDA